MVKAPHPGFHGSPKMQTSGSQVDELNAALAAGL